MIKTTSDLLCLYKHLCIFILGFFCLFISYGKKNHSQHIPSVSGIQGLVCLNCIYDLDLWMIENERWNEMATEFLELNNSPTKLCSYFKWKINNLVCLAF